MLVCITAIWLVSGSVAAFLLFIYEVTEKKSSAILLTTFLTVILLFLSGSMIPQIFFPDTLRGVAEYLLSTFWLAGIGSALEGRMDAQEMLGSLLYGILFFAGAVCLRHKRVVS